VLSRDDGAPLSAGCLPQAGDRHRASPAPES
jgi:hypothetical protein